ncbi:UPF0462 protein C4orf33-like protein [Dinothrombium tinctorium]|uniref:UPF0462 protein C4orf33-like protein n=1 Tax=Dinothrombium tinctorium TaxID=1965070 RepID=A0A443RQ72_9ACAR|nr:UPF0462 protein C4orf33-like protein [Dinothrombium tinctorium]
MGFCISTLWNGVAIEESDKVELSLSKCEHNEGLAIEIDAPFYNNAKPNAESGVLMGLWDYEVVEAFFLGENNRYLELEFGPFGHYLVLLLNGSRNIISHSLNLNDCKAKIDGKRWKANAVIPNDYFPKNVRKFNAYAIHNEGSERKYLALYPTPENKFEDPDFHRLEYFREINFKLFFNTNQESDIWKRAVNKT